jgi:hypothetical protein
MTTTDTRSDQSPADARWVSVGSGTTTPPPASERPQPDGLAPVVDPLLFVHATIHSDLEKSRIAMDNRVRILTTDKPDDDGVMRGFGLTEAHPDVARVTWIAQDLAKLENDAKLGMGRALRRSAIWPWVKAQRGLGEKQVARLLSAIGDPYWHNETINEDGTIRHAEGPRTVSELWAYCGNHVLPASQAIVEPHPGSAGGATSGNPGQIRVDIQTEGAGVAAKRRKGEQANWSTDAKTRAYLIAESCLKQIDADCQGGHTSECRCSPYRVKYDTRRAHTAVTHPDWTDGHSHTDGLRIAAKEILKDLWREAKRLHELPAAHENVETQPGRGSGGSPLSTNQAPRDAHFLLVGGEHIDTRLDQPTAATQGRNVESGTDQRIPA